MSTRGSPPHREPAKGGRLAALPRPPCEGAATQEKPRAARPRVGGADDGPVLGGGLGFPDLSLW